MLPVHLKLHMEKEIVYFKNYYAVIIINPDCGYGHVTSAFSVLIVHVKMEIFTAVRPNISHT
jgi:hypothetical protein